MFQFPGFASTSLCIQEVMTPKGRVSPFRDLWIKACCQLPRAFRRLPRLSSPVIAKASTTCTYSLDPITLSPQLYSQGVIVFRICDRIDTTDKTTSHSTKRANNA